jgi:propionate catabolism operon transcriptional regulator
VGGTRPIPVNVRIISATHCNLEQRVAEGRFRADLFYRLAVLRLSLPPLRERQEDLAPLAEWCLKNALAALGARPHENLHAEVLACLPLLASHPWSGNVRELQNLMQRVALFLATQPLQALTPGFIAAVAPEVANKPAPPPVPAPASSETARQTLARFNGNRAAAASHLGISRTTLWRRLREEG